MKFLRTLWPDRPVLPPLPRPEGPVCVIGDLHGMAGLLDRMLGLIDTQPGAARVRRVFAGDLIDRGSGSADVLRNIHALCIADPARNICLMGNHERMMLDFLADPVGQGARWIANGGDATLASFGISRHGMGDNAADRLTSQAIALRAGLGPDLEGWLKALPLFWQDGDLAVTHAGADPARALTEQDEKDLLWGHRNFRREPRRDGNWVAHGHVIVPEPLAEAGRIAVDIGAYRSGRLSAAWIDAEGLRFLQVQEG